MAIFKPFFSSPSFAAFVSPSALAAVVVFSPAAAVVDFAAPDAPQPAKREATSTAPVRTFQVFFIMRSSPSFTRLRTKGFFLFSDSKRHFVQV